MLIAKACLADDRRAERVGDAENRLLQHLANPGHPAERADWACERVRTEVFCKKRESQLRLVTEPFIDASGAAIDGLIRGNILDQVYAGPRRTCSRHVRRRIQL